MVRRGAALVGLVLAVACGDSGHRLEIELRTDFLPGEEFVSVETVIEGRPRQAEPATTPDDYRSGVRIASYEGLSSGVVLVEVSLRSAVGALVIARRTRLTLDGDFGLVVVISRNCLGVDCAEPTGACQDGVCVPPECRPGLPDACEGAVCVGDDDCSDSSGPSCVVPLCADGACLVAARDDLCPAGSRCHPSTGCGDGPDAGLIDGGTGDGGTTRCLGDSQCPDDAVVSSGCEQIGSVCATTGVEERTTTRWECIGGKCQSSDEIQSIPCMVDTERRPCGECSECRSGACLPADGEVCVDGFYAGACHVGACCLGCWDGAACQAGYPGPACGRQGEACMDCGAMSLVCGAAPPGGACR